MTDQEPVASPPQSSLAWVSSPAGKAGMILALLLLMQIPLFMVSGLIAEREGRQNEVLTGFRRSWGPAQTVAGPVLAVPYLKTGAGGGNPPVNTGQQRGWLQIPASQLSVAATAAAEP